MSAAITVRGLRRSYGRLVAVHDLDLRVDAGEIYGLIGPDGAGKTTTVRAIAGLIGVDRGEIRVDGHPPEHPAVREALGLMPQRYSLYGDLSVGENLRFFRSLFGIDEARARPRVERLLEITRLGPFLDRRADALSGGMYKKLALACALLHEPKVLLLDEPTNGVDPVSRRELWELLGELVTRGMALVVTTPYMDEAERCHRVGLLYEGRLRAEGAPGALVRGLEHPVFLVEGGERARVDGLLGRAPQVLATSPAGQRVRVVVDRAGEAALGAELAQVGASLVPVRASFEDLFLVRTAA